MSYLIPNTIDLFNLPTPSTQEDIFEFLRENYETALKLIADNIYLFVVHEEDFTRFRIITPEMVMNFILSQEKTTTRNNMLSFFDNRPPCSRQALGQARYKIRPDALQTLFYLFNRLNKDLTKRVSKYLPIIADGSDNRVLPNINETDVWVETAGEKMNAKVHLTALMDAVSKNMIDAELIGGPKGSEIECFQAMIDRFEETAECSTHGEIPVFMGDRLFCTFAVLFNLIRHGYCFLIRGKDISTETSFLHEIMFSSKEFDELVTLRLSYRKTKEIMRQAAEDGCIYKHLNKTLSNFPYIPEGQDYVDMTIRVVRTLKEPDLDPENDKNYITLITNLPEDEFSAEEVAQMYTIRWDEETAFKQLKYYCDMETFHSSRMQLVYQEIWAKLTLYNFSHMMANAAGLHHTENYTYPPNFEQAATVSRLFIQHKISAAEALKLLKDDRNPIRLGRSYPRHVRKPGARPHCP